MNGSADVSDDESALCPTVNHASATTTVPR
jgi:hypothetical protein